MQNGQMNGYEWSWKMAFEERIADFNESLLGLLSRPSLPCWRERQSSVAGPLRVLLRITNRAGEGVTLSCWHGKSRIAPP